MRAHLVFYGKPLLPASDIVKRQGWGALWAAAGPTGLRMMCYCGAYYPAFEEGKCAMLYVGAPAPLPTMIGGATAGAAGTMCAHPLNAIVGVRYEELEQGLKGAVITPIAGLDILKQKWRHGGLNNVFSGLRLALMRSMPLNAVVFVVYEKLVDIMATCVEQ